MKLGLLCCYRLTEDQAPLLELQLRQIAKHTRLPYVLYAADIGLPAALRARLAEAPRVRVIDPPATDHSGSPEHSHYLEHLTALAMDDGVSHVATLHADSLPLRPGWMTTIIEAMGDRCALASCVRLSTSCLVFTRSFHETCRPQYLLTDAERQTDLARQVLAAVYDHSGTGHLYRAWQHGLDWLALQPERRNPSGFPSGDVFGGLLFHLGHLLQHGGPSRAIPGPLAEVLKLRRWVPKRWRRRVLAALPADSAHRLEVTMAVDTRAQFQAAFESLGRDPDGFVERLEAFAADLPLGELVGPPQALS